MLRLSALLLAMLMLPFLLAEPLARPNQSGNVSPTHPVQNAVDGESGNAVFSSQGFVRDSSSTVSRNDLSYFVVGQLGHRLSLSNTVPSFVNHVGYIVGQGSKKQMIDVDALPIVASMKDAHSIWNRPASELISHSMCWKMLSPTRAAKFYSPISSSFVNGSTPEYAPRFARGADMAKKLANAGTESYPIINTTNKKIYGATLANSSDFSGLGFRHDESSLGSLCLEQRDGYNRRAVRSILHDELADSTVVLQPHPCGTPHRPVVAQPAPAQEIVTGPVDLAGAKSNREFIESKSGFITLPPGRIEFDQAPALKSGTTLQGVPGSTVLGQRYKTDQFPLNASVTAAGSGQSHVDHFSHAGPRKITTAAPCPVGSLVYLWRSTETNVPSPVRERRTIIARSGNELTLDGAVDARANVLKWFSDANPIADVLEGTSVVNVLRGPIPAVGSTVLVTAGPSIANESTGELRIVSGVSQSAVTLDRPLRRSYRDAALARVTLVENVRLVDLVIELPVNAQSECLQASLCRNWRLDRCRIAKFACGNCADWRFTDCDIGTAYVAGSSHDMQFQGCRIGRAIFEEGTHDCTISDCRIGPCDKNQNCVSVLTQSERITVRNSSLLGGGWPSSQIYFGTPGRECIFDGLIMSGKRPCWLSGPGMRLTAILSDGELSVPAGTSVSQVRASNWQ